ncbi:Uncharacterized protein DBV15_06222, partial [Temnothorax longispinosus]
MWTKCATYVTGPRVRKETGGRNAAVVETATQLRQRLARYQPPTTDVNSYHHPPLRYPTMPAFTHPRATRCARRHSPTVASSAGSGWLIVRTVGVRAMAFPLLPRTLSSMTFVSRWPSPRARYSCAASWVKARVGLQTAVIACLELANGCPRYLTPALENGMVSTTSNLGGRALRTVREKLQLAVQSRLSLVVGVHMRYLAPGTGPAKPFPFLLCGHIANSLSKIRQPRIRVRERRV